MNSAPSAPSGKSAHEIIYGMKVNDAATLINLHRLLQDFSSRIDARESIRLAAMDMKRVYDKSHTWKVYAPGDMVLIRLG
jgi:hypothetical protein